MQRDLLLGDQMYHFIHLTLRLFSTLKRPNKGQEPPPTSGCICADPIEPPWGHVTFGSPIGHAQWYYCTTAIVRKRRGNPLRVRMPLPPVTCLLRHFLWHHFQLHMSTRWLPVAPPSRSTTTNTTLSVLIYSFVDQCLSFSFSQGIICPSLTYCLRLFIWYIQTQDANVWRGLIIFCIKEKCE
jgi:hypothetical protein